MKKIILLTVLATLSLSPVLAIAQSGGFSGAGNASGGGFTGPTSNLMSASEALKLRDDTPVYLEGKITRSLGGEMYEFVDDSGIIILEIDDDDWMGVTVDPNDKIGIWGEIDKEWNSVEVDVDRIVKK